MADLMRRGRPADAERLLAGLGPLECARACAAAARELAESARPTRAALDDDDDDLRSSGQHDDGDDLFDSADDRDDLPCSDSGGAALDPSEPEASGACAPASAFEGRMRAAALDLVRTALDAAPEDLRTRLGAAWACYELDELEQLEELVEGATALPGADPDVLVGLGRLALAVDGFQAADALFARAQAAAPSSLDAVAGRSEALLALDRTDEALPLLQGALQALRRQMDELQLDFGGSEASEERHRRLVELHEEAVSRASSAEKVIDGMAAAGLLDPRAGVNYLLLGHSLLVESTRPARRLLLVDQRQLRADADLALARDPRAPEGHEDLALWRLRAHDLDGARAAFRRAVDRDPDAWPSLVGLGISIQAGSRSLERVLEEAIAAPEVPALEQLVEPWGALTEAERRVVALALAPIARLVPALVDAGGRLQVVALGARLTDLPAFAEVQGRRIEEHDDRRVYDAIDGMCTGVTAAVTVGALYQVERDGWTLAHELGHALHAILADGLAQRIEALYERARAQEWLSTEYGLTNPWDFFATGYERFALRFAFPRAPRTELDEADVGLGVDALLLELTRAAPDEVLAPEVPEGTSARVEGVDASPSSPT